MKYKRNIREIERTTTPVRVVGLTGGIGSGKTTATKALRSVGYYIIDADEISRRMFARGGSGEKELLAIFPNANKDGHLDRALLRAVIAADKGEREKLNNFTHPKIIAEIKRIISEKEPPVVLSAPLLFETALASLCDKTVCVYCPRQVRIKRIIERDRVSPVDAERIELAQIPDGERCLLSDFIVPSDVAQSEFIEEIIELFDAICKIKR